LILRTAQAANRVVLFLNVRMNRSLRLKGNPVHTARMLTDLVGLPSLAPVPGLVGTGSFLEHCSQKVVPA
jgi:hypothetical protein